MRIFVVLGFEGVCLTSATSATSEGAQGIFSKITFLKSVRFKEKDEVCYCFLVKIFTKSLHRGGVVHGCMNKSMSIPFKIHPKFIAIRVVEFSSGGYITNVRSQLGSQRQGRPDQRQGLSRSLVSTSIWDIDLTLGRTILLR